MPTLQFAMDQSASQFPTGDAFFPFDLNGGDINLSTTASYVPDGFSLPNAKQEIDACSYVTSEEYAALSPDILPLSQPSISPSSFASSASASPDALFQDHFNSIPDELFMHKQEAPAAPSAMPLSSTTTNDMAAAMAAAHASLPSPPTVASSTPSPSSKETDKTTKGATTTSSTTTTAANGKPRRKRPNRYHGASEELMQRRRDQNRHSQRAYRERKDQKIKDLEADVASKDRLISQLRNQLRGQQCMHCRGNGSGDFQQPPGRTQQAPPPICTHNTTHHPMHHAGQTGLPPPPPSAPFTQGPGAPYRPAYPMHHTQTALLTPTTPMNMMPPIPMGGQPSHTNTAMYSLAAVAGAPSSL